jgi:hypothetical protein
MNVLKNIPTKPTIVLALFTVIVILAIEFLDPQPPAGEKLTEVAPASKAATSSSIDVATSPPALEESENKKVTSTEDSHKEKIPEINSGVDDAFLATHRETISALVKLKDPDEQGEAIDKYAEKFFPLIDPGREDEIVLMVRELHNMNDKERYVALELLGCISPIEAVDELIEAYTGETNLENQEAIIDVFKFTVSNLKDKVDWESKLQEHAKIKHFFTANLHNFDSSFDHRVHEAIVRIFPAKEVAVLVESGRMPKARWDIPKELHYDYSPMRDL